MRARCPGCGAFEKVGCEKCGLLPDPEGAFAKRLRAWLDRERTIGQVTAEQAEIVDRLLCDLGAS